MKLSLDWIKDFVEIPADLSPKDLGLLITRHTAEVEGVENTAEAYEHMVIGKVASLKKHPDADRLKVAQVDIGKKDPVQIVCGGQNLKEDMLVALALPGAWVRWHGEGEPVQLTESKIRGEKSFGMICAGEEIGLDSDNPEGSTEVRIADMSHLKVAPGTPLASALDKADVLLDIDNKSLTHRPDLWGHYGMAREVSAILNQPLKSIESVIGKTLKQEGKQDMRVDIVDTDIAVRFSACVVSGVSTQASPEWMQKRLRAGGMNPHNVIVDITNYVMLELGQPMHAFDKKMVGSNVLRARKARAGERLITLDGEEQRLEEGDPLVTNEADEILGLAGIKGGLKSGTFESTTEVILEAATWNPIAVRKSSTRLGLRTDASQRFEKSLDPNLTEIALHRALSLIQALCPSAKLETPIVTVGTWKNPEIKITLDAERTRQKIGLPLSTDVMANLLERLEFKTNVKGESIAVEVPSHRSTGDVSMEDDLVEEVARLYGYDHIPCVLPELPIRMPKENTERELKHLARTILTEGLVFTELMNYSFYSKDRLEKCGLSEENHFRLKNALSEDQTHMRLSLLPNVLASLEQNQRSFSTLSVFEFGRSYEEVGAFMPKEEKHLLLAVCSKEKKSPFYRVKGALETLVNRLGLGPIQLKVSKNPPAHAHPKQCMDILIQGAWAGNLMTVHPSVVKAFDLEGRTCIADLNFQELVASGRKSPRFKALPKFPPMPMDLSIVVDQKTTVEEMEKLIKKTDTDSLLESLELFDIYEGSNLESGQKSLSFHLELRHKDRTLTDAEFQSLQERIFLAVETFGAKVRGRS